MTPKSAEEAFAANLRALRSQTSTTQAQLAEMMADRGFKWHPATVYKVENGERQIQLAEALEISRIFDTVVEEMARDAQPQQVIELRGEHRNLRSEHDRLVTAIQYFHQSAVLLARILAVDDEGRSLLPHAELQQMLTDVINFESLSRRLLEVCGQPVGEIGESWHHRLGKIDLDTRSALKTLTAEVDSDDPDT